VATKDKTGVWKRFNQPSFQLMDESSWFSFTGMRFETRVLLATISLLLPAGVQTRFAYTTTHGTITISRYTGPGANVIIPNTVNGVPVKCIGG